MPDYAAHEAVYFSQAITADDFAMKKNPKYVNKVVAPTLEPISSIGGFRTLPDYSFDTMPDDYVALVLIGGFGWNTPVAEKVMPIIKSAIEQEKVIGAICNAASFMAKCGIDRETTSKTLQKSRQFEQSRWMIVVALLLFVVHYMCQMRLGWRQQGNDVGVLFNLLFYSPSAILLSWSQLNILRAGHRRWSFMRYGVVGYALMVLCIVAGVISNGSLHIGPMLYVADAIHFFTLLYYTWAPLRELGNVQRRLDSEHGNPADAYLRTMRFGFFVVCAFAVISPLYILSRPLLFVFGPLGLISLSLFIVSFTALGFSMSEGVTEIVTETNDEIAAAKVFREIGPERIAEIDMAVSKWRSEGGFRDSNLTLSSFARRIMVNRTDVASYLTSIYGKNFRTWLSGIRVEEAKALMAAHPEYSNEVVSMECGFSSRVYFQRLFKERTGLTPAEWRRQR